MAVLMEAEAGKCKTGRIRGSMASKKTILPALLFLEDTKESTLAIMALSLVEAEEEEEGFKLQTTSSSCRSSRSVSSTSATAAGNSGKV